jgi:Recombination enhancement, RecA-dependent nuclease
MGAPVNHKRMKPKAGAEPTADERRHMDRVAAMPCLVSGEQATVHHVTGSAHLMGRFRRSHQLIVPLAPRFHQKVFDPKASDPISVEGLGHRGFFDKYGIDLLAVAELLRLESVEAGIL